jgi:hypothetical protein
MNSLPPEMMIKIFTNIQDLRTLDCCYFVCKDWIQILDDPETIWEPSVWQLYTHYPLDVLIQACEDGRLKSYQNLTNLECIKYRISQVKDTLLPELCALGLLEAVRWVNSCIKIDGTGKDNINHSLQSACLSGNLDLVQYLDTIIKWFPSGIRAKKSRAFRNACFSGNLELVQWLTDRCHISQQDVRNKCTDSLRRACSSGNPQLVKWLVTKFDLETNDARDYLYGHDSLGSTCLYRACEQGHTDVVQLLIKTFKFKYEDTIRYGNHSQFVLSEVCEKGYTAVTKTLVTEFNLALEDIICACGLYRACIGGHIDTTEWLLDNFDFEEGYLENVLEAAGRENISVAMVCLLKRRIHKKILERVV